ncbi:MAG: hypothetical protein IKP68_10485 [Clostridia bacterium]|nr:hypothetical protein [Clostridia bacterium]
MKETISFAPWDFIEVKCYEHKCPLELREVNGRPFYCCPEEDCGLQVPPEIYGKLLDETILRMNRNALVVGGVWHKRFAGSSFTCTVLSAPDGKKPEIGIRKVIIR